MNVIEGNISDIKVSDNLAVIRVNVGDLVINAIVIENLHVSTHLALGKKVRLLFKETEVIISKGNDVSISIENILPAEIKEIERGKLLTKITLKSGEYDIRSIILDESYQKMNLHSGDEVKLMIKTNEIMLSPC